MSPPPSLSSSLKHMNVCLCFKWGRQGGGRDSGILLSVVLIQAWSLTYKDNNNKDHAWIGQQTTDSWFTVAPYFLTWTMHRSVHGGNRGATVKKHEQRHLFVFPLLPVTVSFLDDRRAVGTKLCLVCHRGKETVKEEETWTLTWTISNRPHLRCGSFATVCLRMVQVMFRCLF